MIYLDERQRAIVIREAPELTGPWSDSQVLVTSRDYPSLYGAYLHPWASSEDPICFEQSIRVTIEHGHTNHRSDDYSSTACWYQLELHKLFPALPPVQYRLPRPEIKRR